MLLGSALLVVKVDALSASKAAAYAVTTTPLLTDRSAGSVIGRLEISALGLQVPIIEGFDPTALRAGVGHVVGTALPGGLGNMALAGHRDTFFRPLRGIRRGMRMSVSAGGDTYQYVVDSTSIVKPEDVSVLAIHDAPELTLITCYPFHYVGSAPNRFIVRAHLESASPTQRND
jgi:sortase A